MRRGWVTCRDEPRLARRSGAPPHPHLHPMTGTGWLLETSATTWSRAPDHGFESFEEGIFSGQWRAAGHGVEGGPEAPVTHCERQEGDGHHAGLGRWGEGRS